MKQLQPILNSACLLGSTEPLNDRLKIIQDNFNELSARAGGGGGGSGFVTSVNGQTGDINLSFDNRTFLNPTLNGTVTANGSRVVTESALTTEKQAITQSIEALKAVATTTTPGMMSAADKVKLDGLSTGGGHSEAEPAKPEAIVSSQMYGALNIVVDGGSGASMDGDAEHTHATKRVQFAAQMTITVPQTGWYRIELDAFAKNDGTTFTKGVYLNNGVSKFPAVVGVSTVRQTKMSGKSGFLSFLAKCEAGTAYRISLNSTEAFSAQNVKLTVSYEGE